MDGTYQAGANEEEMMMKKKRREKAVYMNNCKKNDVTFMDIVQSHFIIRKRLPHVKMILYV